MKLFKKKLIIFLLLAFVLSIGVFSFSHISYAGSAENMLFGNQSANFQSNSGLGNTDIRIIIGNVIRVVLGFLGVIAVILILYGGWLYMTSQGEAQQIEKAKQVIISAVIGLVIVLTSFGIATFVINSLYNATGAVGGGLPTCDSTNVGTCSGCVRCAPSGASYGWMPDSSCAGCGTSGPGTMNCDGNTLTPTCDPDNTICDGAYPPGTYFCDTSSGCSCQPLGSVGDPCDSNPTTPTCEASDSMCMSDLHCETDVASPNVCTCVGAPIIDSVSPMGMFCLDSAGAPTNDACRTDADCSIINATYTGCNTTMPNGAPGNFVTISGRYFGTTIGTVFFSDVSGTNVPATFPSSVNANCGDTWQDDQIIVVVPGGAMINGPIRVVRSDSEFDTTNNTHGPVLPDFVRNTITRPGLCLARNTESAPNICAGLNCGFFDNGFNLQGTLFSGTTQALRFGNLTTNVGANNVTGWTNTAVNATVPNLAAGDKSIYVDIDNHASNFLKFEVKVNTDNQPVIDYISPASGPIGQYVTIFGSGFMNFLSGTSQVKFTNLSFGTFNADGMDFPVECRDRWWNNAYITVKVPPAIGANIGAYNVTVTNRDSNTSGPRDFSVVSGTPGPGICLLNPANGPINQPVQIYGDNFGATQGVKFARFYNNVSATVYTGWTNQLVNTNVPTGANSGPVVLAGGASVSNALPFMVGYCSDNSQCTGTQECCGSGTYWSGICRPTGDCSTGGPAMTGYGWGFTTSDGPPPPAVTCGGNSDKAACLADGTCPNSSGECATRSGVTTGQCSNAYCNSKYLLCMGACVYNSASNLCQANAAPLQTTCDTTSTSVLPGYTTECRAVNGEYSGQHVWQTQTKPCAPGSFPDTNGWCTVGDPGTPTTCESCSFGFTCLSGECYISNPVCPTGSTCNGTGDCVKDNDTCECCCRVGYGSTDCCYGLTCSAGGCGNDPTNYGLCTGCRVDLNSNLNDFTPAEQTASDLACNCTGTFGKYCDVGSPVSPTDKGACRDATPCDGDAYTAVCDVDNTKCGPGEFCDSTNCFCKKAKPCDDNPNVLGCDAVSNCDATTEYCDNADCTCKPIPKCDADNNPNTGCQVDSTKCPPNMYCGTNCYCKTGTSCDVDKLTPGCDAASNCTTGFACDNSDCTCKPINGGASDKCVSLVPGCTVGYFGCNATYDCIDNSGLDCRCCCDPANDMCGGNLKCMANKGDCTGSTRGLCCGCVTDSECSGGIDGCGADTCCSTRPNVATVYPVDDSQEVCRNTNISVEFDQKMDTSSFVGNVIVVGDYGIGGKCPNGTSYLVYNSNKNSNIFVRAFNRILAIIQSLLKPFFGGKLAMAYTPAIVDHNYCAVRGTTSGYINVLGNSVLNFSLAQALDSEITYYIIVKGDKNTTDGQAEGVLNANSISMIGNATLSGDYTFNGINYLNSYVWSFKTQKDICEISTISVAPVSYLFQTLTSQSFVASPKAANGQIVTAVPDYNWEWKWKSDNVIVADVTNTLLMGSVDKVQTVTPKNVQDGRTYINATATITTDNVMNPSTVGLAKKGTAQVFVMKCEDPWPAVTVVGTWYPWRDNVEGGVCSGPGPCTETNYELYYCRDSGGAGSHDDLPAIVDANTIVLGSTLKCTDGKATCIGHLYGDVCGTGVCTYNIFKEAYFFREKVSTDKTDLNVAAMPVGKGIAASWQTISGVNGYKLYWGTVTGVYPNYTEIDNAGNTKRGDVKCTLSATTMTCEITGLENNTKYFLNLTSFTKVETPTFGEKTVVTKDTTAPLAPIMLNAVPGDSSADIAWGLISDAVKYVVYFTDETGKALINEYPFLTDPVTTNTIKVPSLKNGTKYYLAVKAIDASGNESLFSNQVTVIPVPSGCNNGICEAGECSGGCTADCTVADCCGIEACNGLIGETIANCPGDCTLPPPPLPITCPNGTCDPGECTAGCTADCTVTDCCGIEGCNTAIGETSGNCNGDCAGGPPPPPPPPPP